MNSKSEKIESRFHQMKAYIYKNEKIESPGIIYVSSLKKKNKIYVNIIKMKFACLNI